jgi:LPS-assembly lipoprotein
MWWSSRVAALALCLALAGCFQPLYSETAHPGVVDAMRAVSITPIKDRIGHYLGEDLIHDLNGSGSAPTPLYRLDVTVALSTQTPTVESQINAATAATSIGDAHFSLVRLSDNKVLLEAKAQSSAVYDRTPQRFADMRAARDAELRIARALADEIEVRVGAALATAD